MNSLLLLTPFVLFAASPANATDSVPPQAPVKSTVTTADTASAATPATPPASEDSPQVAQQSPENDAPTLTLPPATLASVTLGYADHLFADGDYYRAIGEYRRYLYLTRGQGSASARVAMAIGEAYLRGGQLDAATSQFESVAEHAQDPELRGMALLSAGRAALNNEKPLIAAARLAEARALSDINPAIADEATYLLGWARFARKDWNGARGAFYTVSQSDSPRVAEAKKLVKRLDTRGEFKKKDPLTAGALSLIPGLGHMYLGQWNVGIAALSWNALFTFATIWSVATGEWGVAAVLGVFELSWFSGTMFGALNGAFRHNRDVEQNWIDELTGTFSRSQRLASIRKAQGLPGEFSRLLPVATSHKD